METKEKIYRTASKLFLEQGYDNIPMSYIHEKNLQKRYPKYLLKFF